MNVILVGYGKMGKSIEEVLQERGHRVLARMGNPSRSERGPGSNQPNGSRGMDTPAGVRDPCAAHAAPVFPGIMSYFRELADNPSADLAVEFSAPSAAAENVRQLLERGIPTVCGTTGWDMTAAQALAEANGTPFLHAANFSLGMAVTRHVVRVAAQLLAQFAEFQPAIMERHHRAKLDRPSGTAKVLASTIEEAGGHQRVEIASLRQGAVPGEHTVIFDGTSESVEIVHRARSREIFSRGAVAAGEWLATERPRGPVTLDDFLERTCPWSLA